MNKSIIILLTASMLLCLTGCQLTDSSGSVILNGMVNDSLKKPFEEIKSLVENDSNLTLNITYETSQQITDDILQGKIADFVILSSQKNLDELSRADIINLDTQKSLVENSLVVIVPQTSTVSDLNTLSTWEVESIAVGNPQTTSSGIYTENTLNALGLMDSLSDKLEKQSTVRSIIAGVTDNEFNAGIVFKSDAVNNNRIKIIYEFPVETYDTIVYRIAGTNESTNIEAIKEFENRLFNDQSSTAIFTKYGFTSIPQPATSENTPAE